MGIGLVAVVDEAGAEILVSQGHRVIGSVIHVAGTDLGRVVLDGTWR